jgi:hypothetical protein
MGRGPPARASRGGTATSAGVLQLYIVSYGHRYVMIFMFYDSHYNDDIRRCAMGWHGCNLWGGAVGHGQRLLLLISDHSPLITISDHSSLITISDHSSMITISDH